MSPPTDYPLLKRAVCFLASRCDGAQELDGQGFNKLDTGFGKELAATEEWSPRQAHAAYQMLEKYKRQLANAGIDYDSIPEPDLSEQRVLGVYDDELVFKFAGDDFEDILSDVKALPWRRFVPEEEGGPHWIVGSRTDEELDAVQALVDKWDAHVTDGARRRLEEAREGAKSSGSTGTEAEAEHRIILHNGEPALDFPYDEQVKNDLKAHFSHWSWNGDEKLWEVTGNGGLVQEIEYWMELYPEFELTDDAAGWVESKRERAMKNRQTSQAGDSDFKADYSSGSGYQLYPFQRAGVEYATENERILLTDEMGLGKTVQALVTLEEKDAFPAVVVCPASLKQNWRKEANEWVPGRDVRVLEGTTASELGDADVYIMNYAMLSRGGDEWLNAFDEVNLEGIVLDESHYVKNKDAQRSEAAQALAANVPVRLLLTGTPILNRPKELVHQLRVLDRLGEFGGFWDFVKRYCDAHKTYIPGRGRVWDMTGASNTEELNRRLRESCMVRRRKEDVLDELPPKTDAIVPLETNRSKYNEALVEFREWKREATESELQAEAMVRLEKLKQAAVDGKLDQAVGWIEDFIENGEKLVVFAIHEDVIQRLKDEFPNAALIVEGQGQDEREAEKERFQEEEDCRLLIGAMGAHAGASPAGLGHTLTAASNVAFVELGWTPAHHDQCIDRTHRIGQDEPVTAWYLLGDDTIDEEIMDVLEGKREVVETATDGGTVEKSNVATEVAERLGEGDGRG